jgi:uncharacterized membrane protein
MRPFWMSLLRAAMSTAVICAVALAVEWLRRDRPAPGVIESFADTHWRVGLLVFCAAWAWEWWFRRARAANARDAPP